MMSSSSFEIKFPKYVAYRKPDGNFYSTLVKRNSDTPFSGLHMSDVFIYAMSLGFNAKRKTPFYKDERSPNLPASAFDGPKRWLMRALAVSDAGELEIILDNSKVVQIAESYANTGIDILRDLYDSQRKNDDSAVYEEHLRDYFDKLNTDTPQ